MEENQFSRKEIMLNLNKLRIIRKATCRNFQKFRQQYFPHYHKVKDGLFQEELSLALSEMTAKRGVKLAVAAPRESAKSTIVSLPCKSKLAIEKA